MRWNNTRLGKAAGKKSTAAKKGIHLHSSLLHRCRTEEKLLTPDRRQGFRHLWCIYFLYKRRGKNRPLRHLLLGVVRLIPSSVPPPYSLLFATTHLANTLQSRGNGLSTSPCPAQQFSILSSCAIGKGEGRASLQVDDKTSWQQVRRDSLRSSHTSILVRNRSPTCRRM